jgi:hypothetical protein
MVRSEELKKSIKKLKVRLISEESLCFLGLAASFRNPPFFFSKVLGLFQMGNSDLMFLK